MAKPKTISLYVGDKLEVMVHRPLAAGLDVGMVVEVLGFQPNGSPIVSNSNPIFPHTQRWYCDLGKLFHHYKKVGKN